jgi:molecular chaperone DnaK
MGGVMTKLIERNTTIPTSKSEVFSTAADNQPQVEVHVVQGERGMAADNKSLGRFILDGIPSAPRGVPQIEVTFNIDANGILNVAAKDKGTGKEQSITISGSGNLDKEAVEKMAKEAEANAEEDKKKREAVEARNILDNTIYQAEKMKSDYGDKMSEEDKKSLQEAIDGTRKEISETSSKEQIEAATKKLSDMLMPIGAKMYEAAKEEAPAEDTAAPASEDGTDDKKKKNKDGAVEGEVVDEK